MHGKQTAAGFSLLTLSWTSEAGAGTELLISVVVLGLVLLGLVFWLAHFVTDFSGELRYLNIEIGRTEGEERRYYLRRRRRLWLSLIPFVRY